MRKNQRWLMILISIIVIVAFVFLYNKTDLDKLSTSGVGTIYGKSVTGAEFARVEKQFEIAQILGMGELYQILAAGNKGDPAENFVWNTMILRNKAESLRLEPTADAVTQKIQQIPALQTDGQFDFQKYQKFVVNALTPRGFSEEQFNELIRDDLRLSKLRDLVGSSSVIAESEVLEAYGNAFRKRQIQVARLKRESFETPITPEEIKTYFEANRETLKTAEKRSVKYVALTLDEAQKKLTGKERVAVLQPISTQADLFSQNLLKAGADFSAIAQEMKVPVKELTSFTADSLPTEIAGVPQAGPTIFSLSDELKDSDVLQTEDGFYVFHLNKIEPAVAQTLEEATPRITTLLKEEKVSAAMMVKAAELQKAIGAALKSGQTFAQAAEANGMKVESLPAYVPAELQTQEPNPDRGLQMRAAGLSVGGLSDLIPTADGGAIVYLEKMDPLDDAKWKTERESILEHYTSSKRETSFGEWFRAQQAAANIHRGNSEG